LRFTLLLAGILLSVQTLVAWHTHHGNITPDDSCQLCLHAQHHTPAANSIPAPELALFSPIAVSREVSLETIHPIFRVVLPSRAPPTFPLS